MYNISIAIDILQKIETTQKIREKKFLCSDKNGTYVVFLLGFNGHLDVFEFLVVAQSLPGVLVLLIELLPSHLTMSTTDMPTWNWINLLRLGIWMSPQFSGVIVKQLDQQLLVTIYKTKFLRLYQDQNNKTKTKTTRSKQRHLVDLSFQ